MFRLRPVADEDLPLILEWRNRPDIREKMYTTHLISQEEHEAYFERVKTDPSKAYFICEDEAGEPLGVVNFVDIDARNRSAFWGFYAGVTRRGVGSQMEYLALEHAFESLGLHKLNGEVLASNRPVVEFHQKFGFKIEGVLREHHLTPEGYMDVIRIAMLEDEWRGLKQGIFDRVYGRATS